MVALFLAAAMGYQATRWQPGRPPNELARYAPLQLQLDTGGPALAAALRNALKRLGPVPNPSEIEATRALLMSR